MIAHFNVDARYNCKNNSALFSFQTRVFYYVHGFLDVTVVKKGGIVQVDLHCKPTDTHQYLQRGPCHPWYVKKAIPHGRALMIRRICLMMVNF